MWRNKYDSEILDSNLSSTAYRSTSYLVILEYYILDLHKSKVNEMINMFGKFCRRLGCHAIQNKCTVHLARSEGTKHTYGLLLLISKVKLSDSGWDFSSLINEKRLRPSWSPKYMAYFEIILFAFSNSDTIASSLLGVAISIPTFLKYQYGHTDIVLSYSFICDSNIFFDRWPTALGLALGI